ncbi:MAG: Rrf2 family transcriptional regulator, partial [Acidobacteriota bacterium]|nr:Rrf2 family transcriptional regulator [Acidobacteriota bacterium]
RYIEGRQDERWRHRRETTSPFTEIWERVDSAVSEVIDSTTFAALIRDWAEKGCRFVPNWDI